MTATVVVMEAQAFAGNPLQRAGDAIRKEPRALDALLPDAQFCFVKGRQLAVQSTGSSNIQRTFWMQWRQLSQHGAQLSAMSVQLPHSDQTLPVYLLGSKSQAHTKQWSCAVDLTVLQGAGEIVAPWLQDAEFQDLRMLMPHMSYDDLAVAGQAVSLSQWHDGHRFCPRCGAPSAPIEGGAKRACTADGSHRMYPRIDPVVIMLVESVDGTRALLGRSKKIRAGMYTCLSGFVEQGESLEEAVAREVAEEAGVAVERVEMIGSQPWPIGRGGSCELMIGAIAKAAADAVDIDKDEMDDCRWFSRSELQAAVQGSAASRNYFLGGETTTADGLVFAIPPPMAIAHHIIKVWLQREMWFVAKM